MYDYRDDVAAQHRQTYDRILARDRLLFDTDRDGFERSGSKGWDWRYLPAVAANYQVRVERGIARPKDCFRLAEVLAGLEWFEEAWSLLSEPTAELESAIYWFRRAEILLGLGELTQAQASAGRAVVLSGEAKVPKRLATRIDQLVALDAQLQAALTWPAAAAFASEAVALGSKATVARLVDRIVADTPPLDFGVSEAAIIFSRAALEAAPPAAAALIERVLALAAPGDGLAALRLERDLRSGRAQAARAFADQHQCELSGRDTLYLSALAREASGDREIAIRELGPLASRFERDHDIRSALARFVGEDVLARVKPAFAPPRAPGERRRVINLIPFNNEITMLETRLREMGDWVDLFVIVEAAQTFTGGPKRCGFDEIKDQYAAFGDKIRHVKIDAFPDHVDTAWARDCWQRDMAIAALDGWWREDDLVLLTDSDEIVQGEAVADFEIGSIALKMKTYRYFFNYEAQAGNAKHDGHTGVICAADQLVRHGSSYIRFSLSRASKIWNFIPRAGWHFTSMGDADALVRKFSSYAHQEANKTKLKDTGRMGALLAGIRAGQFEDGWARCEIDATYPAVIRERQDDLRELIL